jgi:hypothetical protein
VVSIYPQSTFSFILILVVVLHYISLLLATVDSVAAVISLLKSVSMPAIDFQIYVRCIPGNLDNSIGTSSSEFTFRNFKVQSAPLDQIKLGCLAISISIMKVHVC